MWQEIKIDRSKVKILGHNEKIPKLDLEWLEILLQNCIFDDRENYTKYEHRIRNEWHSFIAQQKAERDKMRPEEYAVNFEKIFASMFR